MNCYGCQRTLSEVGWLSLSPGPTGTPAKRQWLCRDCREVYDGRA